MTCAAQAFASWRAGLSQTVVMQLAGHRTPSVFRRYDVTSESDLADAAAKLDAAADRDSFVTVSPAGQRPSIRQRQIS